MLENFNEHIYNNSFFLSSKYNPIILFDDLKLLFFVGIIYE